MLTNIDIIWTQRWYCLDNLAEDMTLLDVEDKMMLTNLMEMASRMKADMDCGWDEEERREDFFSWGLWGYPEGLCGQPAVPAGLHHVVDRALVGLEGVEGRQDQPSTPPIIENW